MKLAVAGLGKMGMQIARKLANDGHVVIAQNRSPEPVKVAQTYGAQAAFEKQDVVTTFQNEPVVLWLMVPADVVEQELRSWLDIIPKGSIIIDGGNTDFRTDMRHAQLVKEHGSTLLDCGTSGGIMGLEHGFCMMVGGDEQAVKSLSPIFDSLAKPEGSWHYFGDNGAGHYVKMVHNAIEYGMMESLAEGYQMLKQGPYPSLDLAAAGSVWQKGSIIASSLNELAAEAFAENPQLEGVDGYVAESGEARWTLELAKELHIDLPSIQAAFDVRLASQAGKISFATKVLAELRNKFGGHAINKQ